MESSESMSEISVHRTVGNGRCLVIDGTRVAGGKPEFSGDNCVCWWQTNETIGVVDDIEAENARLKEENAKLRELVSLMEKRDVLLPCWRGCDAFCRFYGSHCKRIGTLMGELGFEVNE